MGVWQGESTRKRTGGRRRLNRGKRRFEIGSEVVLTELGATVRKTDRARGASTKTRVLKTNQANVTDPKTGKTTRVAIETVVENPANPHYVRRNIMTRGAVVRTKLGLARITSRPGQHGDVNAVLVGPAPKAGEGAAPRAEKK